MMRSILHFHTAFFMLKTLLTPKSKFEPKFLVSLNPAKGQAVDAGVYITKCRPKINFLTRPGIMSLYKGYVGIVEAEKHQNRAQS
jgi:hypothetical protein